MSRMPDQDVPLAEQSGSPWHRASESVRGAIILVSLYVLLLAVIGPRARLSQWQAVPDDLQPAAEAMAWLDGRLDVPTRGGDVADFNGKYFVHFPPLFTLICAGVFGLHRLILGDPPVFWGAVYVLLVAAPVPWLVYRAMCRACADQLWAALLAFAMLAGTCFWPVIGMLGNKNGGWIYSTQLVMAQSGLALIVCDVLGARRIWPAGIGLLIAAWSRQPAALYAPALLWAAYVGTRSDQSRAGAAVSHGNDRMTIPWGRLGHACAWIAFVAVVPMGLSWAKFGSPLESGYQYIYSGRTDPLAESARGPDGAVRIFGTRYVLSNLYYYHLCPPGFELSGQGLNIRGEYDGVSLWICTPLLLLVLWDVRRWWRDPARRVLMLCSMAVHVALLLYHYTGRDNGGYCRYTLDFILIWLAVIAPWTCQGWRRWFTAGCVSWSVLYFYLVR